ncbi:sensor histidine kinase [Pedobacter faecalis]|uniref:sensor histidine kinase n=1 Tax=Pedobacter faecalis TaxID=3041495 RepID=UPI002550179F|nr:ATP-binding protein [Pedobacter sp. ELA7]
MNMRLSGAIRRYTHNVTELEQTNRGLASKGQLLERAEQIAHIGTWQVDTRSGAVEWSDELYRIYGFTKTEITPDAELNTRVIVPEYREKVAKALESAVNNNSNFAVEYQIMQPSGLRKYILAQGLYLSDESRLVATIQDITELKEAVLKLRINETLLREAEKVSHSGSWEWMEGKQYILWSDEMYNIHGLFPHSVTMNINTYQSLIHEEDLKEVTAEFERAQIRKTPFKLNYRIVRPSGQIRHVLTAGEYKRIGINDNFAYIGTTQDVTELREAQVQLEEKISALNRSNQDLEQFAYVASHDLQEPLRKIQAFSKRLKEQHSGNLDEEAQDYLSRMDQAANRMRVLISDLLTFSKATRDGKRFTVVDLGDLITRITHDMDYTIEQKQATISVSASIGVYGVETQLYQLFLNLIGNALKFTKSGQPPHVKISAQSATDDQLNLEGIVPRQQYASITIEDNGIGFDRNDAGRIFDLFHRQHIRSEYEGTGIGLAICKKIVSYHNGLIYADSEPGQGSVFTVLLPKKHTNTLNLKSDGKN